MSERNGLDKPRPEGRNDIVHLHEIIHLLESGWAGKHILVVGDVMLDKYIHGSVDRTRPKHPYPLFTPLDAANSPVARPTSP